MGPGRALAVGFEGTRVPDDLVALAEHAGLGGVVLFARNCPNLETVLALTAAARKLGPDVLVLVDHEGGRVHRLPPPFTRFPPAAAVGRSGDPHLAVAVARAMARELRAAGFDSGLAPVLDCLLNPANTVIDDRAFGTAPISSPRGASRSSRPCSPKGWFPSPSTSRGTDAPRSTRISPCRTSTRPSTNWSAGISFHSAPPSEPAARR